MKISQIIVTILAVLTAAGLSALLDVDGVGTNIMLGLAVGMVGAVFIIALGD